MKGQMFILTMVFLVGLVFVVQQGFVNWFSYSMDFFADTQKNDYYLFDNVRQMIDQSIIGSSTCSETSDNMDELNSFLQSRILRGYFVEIDTSFDCINWYNSPPAAAPLRAGIHITGENIDTYGDFLFYKY